jgi:hypothetical protein
MSKAVMKPCPFCGAHVGLTYAEKMNMLGGYTRYCGTVRCSNLFCYASVKAYHDQERQSIVLAKQRWNRRAKVVAKKVTTICSRACGETVDKDWREK